MINLKKISTKAPQQLDKKKTKEEFKKLKEKLFELQDVLMASKTHSILVILQGMDASGKDGAARDVFSGLNICGLQYKAFKSPSKEELEHDYLWRVHASVPPKGYIGVFNRSHYEDVMIQRVHKWHDETVFQQRFEQINAFEKMLVENNCVIIKCYMHISPEKQLENLTERKTIIEKMWKHNDGDWEERKLWDEYMKCYHDVLNKCNTVEWNIIPADNNWYKEYLILKLVIENLEKLKLKYPKLNPTT